VLLAIWYRRPSFRDSAVAAAIAAVVATAASELISAMTAHPRPFMLGKSPMYVAHAAEGSLSSAHASLKLGAAAVLLLAQGTRAWGTMLAGWARVYVGLYILMDIAGSIVAAALAAALLRGNTRGVAWLRRQLERATGLGIGGVTAAAGKRSAARQRSGKQYMHQSNRCLRCVCCW
jgi:undecaprenyl-diphosphatase